MARAHSGTVLECFSTEVFPARTVGMAKRRACQKGKFQGMMERMTPRGWYVTRCSLPSASNRSSSSHSGPFSANTSEAQAHFSISARASLMGLPISVVMSFA